MKEKLPKICDASTSEVLYCENTECPYHIKHYDNLGDWFIVHPSNVDCKDKENEE